MLRAVFIALTLTGFGAAAADQDPNMTADTSDPSLQVRPADFWFNPDALDLNVYGLAYHPDRDTVHSKHLDNEVNPGLGLHYEFTNSKRGITFGELGVYEDSGSNTAKFAALGYQFKFGKRFRIGAALGVVQSLTYNKGVAFVGMIPLISYDLGRVKLNMTYLPKLGSYNKVDAFGFYISIPFGQWEK